MHFSEPVPKVITFDYEPLHLPPRFAYVDLKSIKIPGARYRTFLQFKARFRALLFMPTHYRVLLFFDRFERCAARNKRELLRANFITCCSPLNMASFAATGLIIGVFRLA